MSDSSFFIIDKNLRFIKKDSNGMLCIFDSKDDAEKYLDSLPFFYAKGCIIKQRKMVIS